MTTWLARYQRFWTKATSGSTSCSLHSNPEAITDRRTAQPERPKRKAPQVEKTEIDVPAGIPQVVVSEHSTPRATCRPSAPRS